MTRIARLGTALLVTLAASCGGDGDPGSPAPAGDLVIGYSQNGPDAGAILFTITGGAVESVSAGNGQSLQVAFSSAVPGATKVLVSGVLHAGDILRFRVPDAALSGNYVARIDQVADDVTFALINPSLHQLTVHR